MGWTGWFNWRWTWALRCDVVAARAFFELQPVPSIPRLRPEAQRLGRVHLMTKGTPELRPGMAGWAWDVGSGQPAEATVTSCQFSVCPCARPARLPQLSGARRVLPRNSSHLIVVRSCQCRESSLARSSHLHTHLLSTTSHLVAKVRGELYVLGLVCIHGSTCAPSLSSPPLHHTSN